jgi:hypothetical protein
MKREGEEDEDKDEPAKGVLKKQEKCISSIYYLSRALLIAVLVLLV